MPDAAAAPGGLPDRTDMLAAYIDFKSPYAYLAVEPTRKLARDCGVAVDWLPLTLNIPDYLGSARLDADGRVIEQDRTDHQWRRVKYAYMDVRRYANLRGMTIRGTTKIWDSSIAAIGLLFAREQGPGPVDRYVDLVYPPFWRRELDIEDPAVIAGLLDRAGADTAGFGDWLAGPGRALHDRLRAEAEAAGIFGVPFYTWQGEGFWGREQLPLLRYRITGELPANAAELGMAPAPDAGGNPG